MSLYSLVTGATSDPAASVSAHPGLLTLTGGGQSFSLLEQNASHLLNALIDQLHTLPDEIARRAEAYDLAGLPATDAPHPYTEATRAIDHLIGRLKATRADIQRLAAHQHTWDPDTDYCTVCGADGRA